MSYNSSLRTNKWTLDQRAVESGCVMCTFRCTLNITLICSIDKRTATLNRVFFQFLARWLTFRELFSQLLEYATVVSASKIVFCFLTMASAPHHTTQGCFVVGSVQQAIWFTLHVQCDVRLAKSSRKLQQRKFGQGAVAVF